MFFDRLPGRGYVCAHRGARSLAPENTLAAARKAVESGADFWELDIQTTRDGELVVFHDDDLARTADVALRPEFAGRTPWDISDFSLSELGSLDAGSWFLEKDPFKTLASGEVSPREAARFAGTRIPTLLQALEFCRDNDFPVNLEIKDHSGRPGHETVVARVLALIEETGTAGLILLSSFHHPYLHQAARLAPAIPRAALVEEAHPADPAAYVRDNGFAAYHPDYRITPPAMAATLGAAGVRVNLWTVNDADLALAYFEAGAGAVITDFPQRLRGLKGK